MAAAETNSGNGASGVWPGWATGLAVLGLTLGVIVVVHLFKTKK